MNNDWKLIDKIAILLELIVFRPYYQLNADEDAQDSNQYAELKPDRGDWWNGDPWLREIYEITKYLSIEEKSVDRLNRFFEGSVGDIKGGSNLLIWIFIGTVLFGLLAPFSIPVIVSVFGPIMGLSGAAATSAVLAALGGGAIAVGGFGMAGGFVVVIGGGALLGGVAGGVMGKILKSSPDVVIFQGAKLISIIKEVNEYNSELAFALANSTIDGLRKSVRSLEEEFSKEYRAGKQDKDDQENISKSIRYFEKVISLLEDFVRANYHIYGNKSNVTILLDYTGSHRQIYTASPQLPFSQFSDVESLRFSPVCSNCQHLNEQSVEGQKRSCKAFLQGIPDDIWQGYNLHQNPYPGDNGIQFKDKYS